MITGRLFCACQKLADDIMYGESQNAGWGMDKVTR